MSTITVSNVSDGTLSIPTTFVTNGSAKAWVNFDGTGTIAARDSLNLSSLTDNGTGDYDVNLSSSFAAGDYAATMNNRTGASVQSLITVNADTTPSASVYPIYVVNPTTPLTLQDESFVMVALFGDLA